MADEQPSTKRCPKCDTIKPATDFGRARSRNDGLKGWCKACHNAASLAHYHKNPERHHERSKAWRKAHPERAREHHMRWRLKNIEAFNAYQAKWRAENPDKVRARNAKRYLRKRASMLAACRKWYSENGEQQAEYRKLYRAKNKAALAAGKRNYKARKRQAVGMHTADDIREIMKLQRSRCAYCAVKLGKVFHVDHVVSLARGGSNNRSNLQITCPTCNIRKKDKDPLAFAQQLGRLL